MYRRCCFFKFWKVDIETRIMRTLLEFHGGTNELAVMGLALGENDLWRLGIHCGREARGLEV